MEPRTVLPHSSKAALLVLLATLSTPALAIESPGKKWQATAGGCFTPINSPNGDPRLADNLRQLGKAALGISDETVGCVTFPYMGMPYDVPGIGNEAHAGIDFRANGDAVFAVEGGRVVERAFDPANGRSTLIIENNGRARKVLYLHMSRIDVSAGEQVPAGKQIGIAGTVGACPEKKGGCPHLHLEAWGLGSPLYCSRTKAISGSACLDEGGRCSWLRIDNLTIDPTWIVTMPDNTPAPSRSDISLASNLPIEFGGVGPVRVGMTVAQISTALRDRVMDEYADDAKSCGYARAQSAVCGISFMITNGRVSRIDVEQGDFRTAEGIGIGSTEAQLRHAYGARATSQPNSYTETARDWTVEGIGKDHDRAMVFVVDKEKVVNYRAGDDTVHFIEGCY